MILGFRRVELDEYWIEEEKKKVTDNEEAAPCSNLQGFFFRSVRVNEVLF